MRVTFERTGGFAGMRLSTTIDASTLPEDEVSQLEIEIDQAGFFDLPSRVQGEQGGADRFEYHIWIEFGHRSHSVEVGDASVPDSLRPLLEHLEQLMRTRR